jgi:hypothetical protein
LLVISGRSTLRKSSTEMEAKLLKLVDGSSATSLLPALHCEYYLIRYAVAI